MYKLKKISGAFSAVALSAALLLSGCSGGNEEIKIPIYEKEITYNTVEAKRQDLIFSQNIGGTVGYAFCEKLEAPYKSNLISINVGQYDILKEGDIIAVLDSSEWDYELLEKQIISESAYEVYQASPSESNRLAYEAAKADYEKTQYIVDSYTIKAPYDCIVTQVARLEPGTEISAGADICSVARENEIYVYTADNVSNFHLGMKAQVKFTGEFHEATVVSVPEEETSSGGKRNWGGRDDGTHLAGPVSADRNVILKFQPEVLEAALEETPNAVTAGWCTIRITTNAKYGVLTVPDKAVKKYSGGTYVNVLENDQELQIPVEVGESINGYTIILSGIDEGEKIILD